MNKSSVALLAKAISSKRGLKQAEAERFVAKMFEVASQALDEDKQLKVKWLGTFKVAPVKDRESVDVNTGERIVIEGRDKISFTPDNILKEIINKPFAQFDTVVVNDGIDFSDIDEKFAQMRDEEETAIEEPASESSEEVAVEESTSEPSEEVAVEECSSDPSEEIAVEQVVGQESSLVTVSDNTSEVSFSSEKEVCASVEEPFEEVPSAEEPSVEEPSEEEIQPSEEEEPMGEEAPEVEAEKFMASESASSGEEEMVSHAHHFVIPKYMVAVVLVLFVVLLGGMGWLAFNYGKMQAQRDHLAAQLVLAQKKQPIRVEKKKSVAPVPQEDSVQAALKVKAKEDSVRLAASSEAVKLAEKAEKTEKTEKEQVTATTESSDKYNGDPRVRTGAYRIVGVAQTVTVSSGQTLESLSKRYLGAGMECYVEALNGTSVVKEGQKLKIPKLELKRKAK